MLFDKIIKRFVTIDTHLCSSVVIQELYIEEDITPEQRFNFKKYAINKFGGKAVITLQNSNEKNLIRKLKALGFSIRGSHCRSIDYECGKAYIMVLDNNSGSLKYHLARIIYNFFKA